MMLTNRLISVLTTVMLFVIVESCYAQPDSIKIVTNSPLAYKKPNKNCSAAICLELKRLIDNSRKSIDFAIYGLRGQSEIVDALINAQRRGVLIRGVIDKNTSNSNYYKDTYLLEKHLKNVHSDYGSDIRKADKINRSRQRQRSKEKCKRPNGHEGPLQCFEGRGYASRDRISFRGDIMHNKFFVIDQAYVWTGSANVSDTGVGGYNANIIAIIHSNYFAKFFTLEFEQMFVNGLYHREKTEIKKKKIQAMIQGSPVSLFFSPQGYAMRRGLLPLLRQAQSSIDVSIFFLTHKEVAKELVNAKNRGVKVRVILDATAATNGYSKHSYLREHGVLVKVENWGGKMHMKAAIVDEAHIILGSMNWTSAGESKNDENTIIIRDAKAKAVELSKFFQQLWESIPRRWLKDDPTPESLDSGSSCFDGIDNDFDKVIDECRA